MRVQDGPTSGAAGAAADPAGVAGTPPDPDAAVSVRGLAKRFGDVEAVRGIDLDVARGGTFGFLGPNGAGKSTTIKLLCTLANPTGGTALVAGHDVLRERLEVRRRIGLVFQDTTLDVYFTAEENLRFHADLYGVPRAAFQARADEVLEMVGLADRRDRIVGTFSGGMKRRLEIARGLLHSPQVLFLDEPTVGLDPQTRASIWEYVRELQAREGVTIFMTTHYMDEAEYCDRIAIIDHGRLLVVDTPAALKGRVGADRVRIETADDAAAVTALAEHFGVTGTRGDGGITFHVPDGEEFVPLLFERLGVRIRSVSVARPSLDDVFMSWTGRTIRDAEVSGAEANRQFARMRMGGRGMATTTSVPTPVRTGAAPTAAPAGWRRDLQAVGVVWRRELMGFSRNRARMSVTFVQPVLFLFVLGTGLSSLTAGSTGGLSFRTFVFPGVVAMTALMPSFFAAGSIVYDREYGFLREMLVAPVRRGSIVIGKVLGGATVASLQVALVIALAGTADIPYDPVLLLELVGIVLVLSFALVAGGVMAAARITQFQSFMAVVQLVMFPLMFLSGTLFPLHGLPTWLGVLTKFDPVTYAVDPLRKAVFAHVDASPAVRDRLAPGVTWAGWHVPVPLELAIVGVMGLAMLAVAIAQFQRTE